MIEKLPPRWPILFIVMAGVFLSTMDSGMVNVALPTIMRAFSLPLQEAKSVVTFYLGTITVSLVFWGRLSDRVGKGLIYLVGVLIFAIGTTCCFFAVNFTILLASRIVQACGASMMMSTGPAIIKTVFQEDHLGRSLGLVGVATACGLLSGPYISGVLIEEYSWRVIFIISLPVCGLVLFFGSFLFFRKFPGANEYGSKGFDWRGSCCWIVIVVLFLSIFQKTETLLSWLTGIVFFLLLLSIYIFVRIEKKVSYPILPMFLLEKKFYWVAVITAALSFGVLFCVLVLIPFYLDFILHLSVAQIGEIMMAVPTTLIVLSPLSGALYDKIGARLLTTVGLAISSCALISLAFLSSSSTSFTVALRLALLGAGQSVFLSPNSASVLSHVGNKYSSISAGILATARNMGMVSGAALAAGLFSVFFSHISGGGTLDGYNVGQQNDFLLALRYTFIVASIMGCFGCLVSSLRD